MSRDDAETVETGTAETGAETARSAQTAAAEPAAGGPPDAVAAEAAPDESGPGLVPAQRVESAAELLDATFAPERAPLFQLPAIVDTPRGRRIVRGAAAVLTVAAVAGVAGTVTHSRDVGAAADDLRDRPMMRLIGGGAAMELPQDSGSFTNGRLGTQLRFTVRNDGGRAEQISGLTLDAPGVAVISTTSPGPVAPGAATVVTAVLSVDCNRADLVDHPASVTFRVAPVAPPAPGSGKTAAPRPLGPERPVTMPITGRAGTTDPFGAGASNTGSFFDLCGGAELIENGVTTSYGRTVTSATPAKPEFSYQVSLRGSGPHPDLLRPTAPIVRFPGLRFTGTDPASTQPLSAGGPVTATVTVTVTDCGLLKRALTSSGGVANLTELSVDQMPFQRIPADPRFRTPGSVAPVLLDVGLAALAEDLLRNLVAACPGLE